MNIYIYYASSRVESSCNRDSPGSLMSRASDAPMQPKPTGGVKRPAPGSRGNSPLTKQTKLTEKGASQRRAPENVPTGPRAASQWKSPLDSVQSPASVHSPVQSPAEHHSHVGSGASTPTTGAPPAPNMLPLPRQPKPPSLQRAVTAPNLQTTSTSTSTSNALVPSTNGDPRHQRRSPSSTPAGGGNIHSLRNMRAAKQNSALMLRTNADGTAIVAAKPINAGISQQQLEAAMSKLRDELKAEILAEQQNKGAGAEKLDKAALKAIVEESELVQGLKREVSRLNTRIQTLESRPTPLTDEMNKRMTEQMDEKTSSCEKRMRESLSSSLKHYFSRADANRDHDSNLQRCKQANDRISDLRDDLKELNAREREGYATLKRRLDKVDGEEHGSVKLLEDQVNRVKQYATTLRSDLKNITDARLLGIEGSMTKLQGEIEEGRAIAQKQTDDLDAKVHALEKRVDEGFPEIDTKISKLDDKIASMEKTYEEKYATPEVVDERISVLKNEMDTRLLQTYDEKYATPEQVSEKISTLKNEMDTRLLQTTRRDTPGHRESYAEIFDSGLAARVSKLEDGYSALAKDNEDFAEDMGGMTQKLGEVEQSVGAIRKDLVKSTTEIIFEKVDPLEEQITKINERLRDYPDLANKIQNHTARLDTLHQNYVALYHRLDDPAHVRLLIQAATTAIIQETVPAMVNTSCTRVLQLAKSDAINQTADLRAYVETEKNNLWRYAEQQADALQILRLRYEAISTKDISDKITHWIRERWPSLPPHLHATVQRLEREVRLLLEHHEAMQAAQAQTQNANANGNRNAMTNGDISRRSTSVPENGLAQIAAAAAGPSHSPQSQSQSVTISQPHHQKQHALTPTELQPLQDKLLELENRIASHGRFIESAGGNGEGLRDQITSLSRGLQEQQSDYSSLATRLTSQVAFLEGCFKEVESRVGGRIDGEGRQRNEADERRREEIQELKNYVFKELDSVSEEIKKCQAADTDLQNQIGVSGDRIGALEQFRAVAEQDCDLWKQDRETWEQQYRPALERFKRNEKKYDDTVEEMPFIREGLNITQVVLRDVNKNGIRPLPDAESNRLVPLAVEAEREEERGLEEDMDAEEGEIGGE